ncbi:MAG: DUF1501 domain-containing protein [Gemmataceae bacterium]
MLTLRANGPRLCDGLSRRDILHAGGLGLLGLSLPELLRAQAHASAATPRRARACILLFLMGGPPQHSTWDPKPDAPAEVRGEFGPMRTNVSGIQICELMPRLAQRADKLCILRAVATDDNAHSSSGYYMMTGVPHAPKNVENANPGAPNNWPNLGGIMQKLRGGSAAFPAAVRLPHRIFNTDGSVWPGQDAGMLGRSADPWLLRCEPATTGIADFSLAADVPLSRIGERHALLNRIDHAIASVERRGALAQYDHQTQQAFDLLRSIQSRNAFNLEHEPAATRDRYGRGQFGQSVLLARRLVEAGVGLIQVNWFRGPEEPSDAPCWDSHANEGARLKNVLVPPTDNAFAALLDDLEVRGLLDDTLIVCLSEFGRTPRFNGRAGRDHWGHVFSVALAGAGIRGGQVLGASDRIAAYPRDGRVKPEDITATIFHCLGYGAETEVHDTMGRPLAISRGQVIRAAVT